MAKKGEGGSDARLLREKLMLYGAGRLSDAELIAILTGEIKSAADDDPSALAENLIRAFDSDLARLSTADISRLRQTAGIGVKRAALLAVAFELGRRAAAAQATKPLVINGNDDVISIFREQMSRLAHEEFWVVYLSSANTVIDKARVSQGGVSGTVVDYKLVVKRALELLASSMILVHNHPSGIALPSEEDRALTTRVAEAAALFDIAVLDHLIITPGASFSFRAAGLL